MKIEHKIERLDEPNNSRFSIQLTDMNTQEYENVRTILRVLLTCGQFEDAESLAKQVNATHIFNKLSIYDRNRLNAYEI